jgi:hypothetical protein
MQTALPLEQPAPLPSPTRDAAGYWQTRWPGVTVGIDERPRHIVPHAGPLDVDPGPDGNAFGHRFMTGYRPPLGDWRRVHVMSAAAGGEIRGYELEAGGTSRASDRRCGRGKPAGGDAEVERIVAEARRTS